MKSKRTAAKTKTPTFDPSNYPTSIVVHGLAVNMTVQSYNEAMDFGLIACARAMPHVAEWAAHIQEAFDELKALPHTAAAPAAPVASATSSLRASAPSRKRVRR